MLYCDDLSFEADEPGYKALKVVLDGSIAAASENCLIYATSNRRHLMPEYMQENLEYKHVGEEIHPGETSEEKISLSERFGLWVSFYPFDQDDYLEIVARVARALQGRRRAHREAVQRAALQWALQRGSRSGRVAWQFARDWAGTRTIERGRRKAEVSCGRRHRRRSVPTHRSRRGGHLSAPTAAFSWRSGRRARSTPATGNFPAARSSRASAPHRAGARAARGARHRRRRAPIPGSRATTTTRTPHVRLRFFRVSRWSGELHGRENQRFAWQSIRRASPSRRCCRPTARYCGRSHCRRLRHHATPADWARRISAHARAARSTGLRLVQVREKELADAELLRLAAEVVAAAHAHGARVLVNGEPGLARSRRAPTACISPPRA